MKKVFKKARMYAIMGLLAGIYYREMTKVFSFEGKTQLAGLHTHILMLGMFMMIMVLILIKTFKINRSANYKKFMVIYESGLHLTIVMMLIRGTLDVMATDITSAVDKSISGFAGLGHIVMGIGFLYMFNVLNESIQKIEK